MTLAMDYRVSVDAAERIPSSSAQLAVLEAVRDLLRDLPPASSESECVSRLSLLEDVKSAAVAAQVRETAAFSRARHDRESAEGVPAAQRGRGLGSEIALARRESPSAGSRFLGMARTLVGDMPNAIAALTNGALSEFGATLLVKEVIALPRAGREAVDARLAEAYGTLGIGALSGRARALANQVDPHAQMVRHQIARSERRVTVRSAPDSMAYLTALIPVTQAFACKKALIDAASIAPSESDEATTEPRSSSQAQADILVERLTGQSHPDAIPVELCVVMTDTSVFGTSRAEAQGLILDQLDDQFDTSPGLHGGCTDGGVVVDDDDGRVADPAHVSAWVPGLGPLSAAMARDLLSPRRDHPKLRRDHDTPHNGDPPERVFLRRVLTDPITGEIRAMDTRRRAFSGTLRRALILRDDRCRTPRCDAPIVHLDHTHPFILGGRTCAANGAGLCARCNYTKEYEGWQHEKVSGSEELTVTTPTGHRYSSLPPPLFPRLAG